MRLGNMTFDQLHNKFMVLDKRKLKIQKELNSIGLEQNILANELWWRLKQKFNEKERKAIPVPDEKPSERRPRIKEDG